MTKTYSDIEAVTRLLEEKEKDLELTARIGKELLEQNGRLESRVAALEEELSKCRDTITQLQHEILRKTELIQVMTSDSTPVSEDESGVWPGLDGGGGGGGIKRVSEGFKLLERKISQLEKQNSELRNEACRLAQETEESEEQESSLVKELMGRLQSERGSSLARDVEIENMRQAVSDLQDSVENLQDRLKDMTQNRDQMERERDEYVSKWAIGRETENELCSELADLKDKYNELLTYLEEVKDSMKKNKKKGPTVRAGPLGFPSLTGMGSTQDSLANELESSLLSELSLDSGISAGSHSNIRRVFETVRCASTLSQGGSLSRAGSSLSQGGISGTHTPSQFLPPTITGFTVPTYCSTSLLPPPPPISMGGVSPQDLEQAVNRLTPGAIAARRQALSSLHTQPAYPYDCMTPDSLFSHGSGSSVAPWKLPDKLQIVKPLEGSLTLHHWSELATPSLSGLLEERPGVKTRGGTDLEALGFHTYSMSDVEEDEEVHPGKSFQQSGHIYTYTNSTVGHHVTSQTRVTHSYRGSQMSSVVSSRVTSVCSTPVDRGLSRRSSVSSITSVTREVVTSITRDVTSVRDQIPPTVTVPPFTPTATPPPSPTRSSPDTSDDEEEPTYSTLGLPGFLMTSGAELLKRTLGSALKSPTAPKPKTALVRPDHKAALTGIRLVETLERIGLEEILATGPSSTLHQAGLRKRLADSVNGPGVLGVPGRPGRGELRRRQDLGSVPLPQHSRPDSPQPQPHSTLESGS